MTETGEQPQPIQLKSPESQLSPEKNTLIESLGKNIDEYFQAINSKTRLVESDIETIRGVRRLNEALEIGEYVRREVGRGQTRGNEQVTGEINGGLKQVVEQVDYQTELTRKTFRNGEFDEFSDLIRRSTGEWQGGATKEFLDKIREILSEPEGKERKLQELQMEFQHGVTERIGGMADNLRRRTSNFERDTYETGDRAIRGLRRVAARAEELPRGDRLYGRVAERVEAMLVEVRGYYNFTGKAREELPIRFKQIQEWTFELEEGLKKMFEELAN